MNTHHELKLRRPYFESKFQGKKPWEIRELEDRTFLEGDTVTFLEVDGPFQDGEWKPTGRTLGPCTIIYTLIRSAGSSLVPPGTCIFTHSEPLAQAKAPEAPKDDRLSFHEVAILKKFGPGKVVMSECSLCGNLRWVNTQRNSPDLVILERGGPVEECEVCMANLTRNPGLVNWLLRVMERAIRAVAPGASSLVPPTHQEITRP